MRRPHSVSAANRAAHHHYRQRWIEPHRLVEQLTQPVQLGQIANIGRAVPEHLIELGVQAALGPGVGCEQVPDPRQRAQRGCRSRAQCQHLVVQFVAAQPLAGVAVARVGEPPQQILAAGIVRIAAVLDQAIELRCEAGRRDPRLAPAVERAQNARRRYEVECPVTAGILAHAVDHWVERAVRPGEDVAGRDRDQMTERVVQVDRRCRRQRRQVARHVLGQFNQHRAVRQQRAVVEGRVNQSAVPPPRVALGVQHAAAGGELEDAADPGQARVIVVIVLHDPANAVRVADHKKALPEQAAGDEQFLEQFLVARRQRILLGRPQQPQRR